MDSEGSFSASRKQEDESTPLAENLLRKDSGSRKRIYIPELNFWTLDRKTCDHWFEYQRRFALCFGRDFSLDDLLELRSTYTDFANMSEIYRHQHGVFPRQRALVLKISGDSRSRIARMIVKPYRADRKTCCYAVVRVKFSLSQKKWFHYVCTVSELPVGMLDAFTNRGGKDVTI